MAARTFGSTLALGSVGVLLASICVGLGNPAAAEEGLPKVLSCAFTGGAAGTYESGDFSSKPPHPLDFTIENIDLEQQSATLKTEPDGKVGKLSVIRAINANHFLEVVNEGFLNLTTVYDLDPKTGKFPAVHSRHFGLFGQPVFGQYTGFCTAK